MIKCFFSFLITFLFSTAGGAAVCLLPSPNTPLAFNTTFAGGPTMVAIAIANLSVLLKIRGMVMKLKIDTKTVKVLTSVIVVFFSISTSTASLTPLPLISTSVTSLLGVPVFSISPLSLKSYNFSSGIDFRSNSPFKVDLYFGIISPVNNDIFTWVNDETGSSLKKGLSPIVKAIEQKIDSRLGLIDDIKYSFTGQEPLGMYLVFSLLVLSNADPSDSDNWIGIDMTPLFLTPPQ